MMSTPQLKSWPLFRLAGVTVLAVWLTGCATAQPVQPNDGLVVSDISPDEVRQSGATGSVVRWGGTITGISNLEDGTTSIELVSRPLHKGGRPIHNDKTEGRFIAETADFLDPAIIKVGRDFTLVGTVTGVRDGKVGEAEYQFPVVALDNYRYWNTRNSASPGNYPYGYYPYWNGYSRYGYDPFFRHSPFRPFRRHHRRSGVSGSILFNQR